MAVKLQVNDDYQGLRFVTALSGTTYSIAIDGTVVVKNHDVVSLLAIGFTYYQTSGGGSAARVISAVSSTTTGAAAANTDYVYICTGTFNYTQPTAVGNSNRYTIKNAGVGVITVQPAVGGQTLEGQATLVLNPGQSAELVSDNSNWNDV